MTAPVRRLILMALTGLTLLTIAPPTPLVAAGPGAAIPAPKVLTASVPANNFTHLDLAALDGHVDITASPDPGASLITIKVSLEPPRMKNFSRPTPVDLSQVELQTAADKTLLRVSLTNARVGGLEAGWTIVVPARFAVRVSAHDGAVTITGIEGGVEAAVNSGLGGRGAELVVDVPRGRLLLDVGVGRLKAHRRSATFDQAEVSATVGDAELFLLGHEIKAPRAPGPGHRVRLGGDGPDTLKARVSVGDVSLRIG